jgi:hypothetical protein
MLIVATAGPVFADQTTFYFHDNSELTFSYPAFQVGEFQVSGIEAMPSSSSAQAFSAATPMAPTASGTAAVMSTNISVAGLSQPAYVAFVAWVTNPFPVAVTLDGNVVMHVWMASNDSFGFLQGSVFFMGAADYSPQSSSSFQLLDNYASRFTFGNTLNRTATEITETLTINQHQFQAGSMIMFFAGAGSNKQAYSFTVYFDSPTWQSRADIPTNPSLTVSEFPNLSFVIYSVLLLPIIQTKRRRTRR